MKRIFLLSGFLLTQSLFATTLTLYNSGVALVQESIALDLTKTQNEYRYRDIPRSIISNSVHLELPKRVKLLWEVYQKDMLLFYLQAQEHYNKQLALSYLARNISFHTDYELFLEKKSANLYAWAEISNNSSKDFYNTKVNLLSGTTKQASHNPYPRLYKSVAKKSASSVATKATQGYYKYTIKEPLTLLSGAKTRIKLFEQKGVVLQNSYVAKMNNPLYLIGERSTSVVREIRLKNLSKALPKGVVRIYTKDADELLLLGEERIENTPKQSSITLSVGEDFDTKVLQSVISRNDTNKAFKVRVNYKLINHSDETKLITLEIPFHKRGDAKVLSTQKHTFSNADMVTFTIKVAPNTTKSFEATFSSSRR